jgi:PAS domain S-box-containing protein
VNRRGRDVLALLILVIAYVVAARIGFRAAFVAEQVSPVWPPTGIAIAALLYFGSWMWPAVWLGALIANATTDIPLIAAASIGTGNTLEAVAAVALLRRFTDVDRSLERLRHITVFLLAAVVISTAISATIGVTTLCAAGLQPWPRFGELWQIWWLGDATGALLVAPVLLTIPLWFQAKEYRFRLEVVGLVAIVVAVSLAIFVVPIGPFAERHLEFAVFPLVIWAGLRFAHPGAALVSLTISLIATWGTLQGSGPFSVISPLPEESVILLQIYTAVIATSGLVLGGAVADRNRAERLREADHSLTTILAGDQDLKRVARGILQSVCSTLDWEAGILWQTNNRLRVLEYVDSWQRDHRSDEFIADSRTRRFEPGVGLPGRVWASAQPTWIYDVVVDRNFPRAPFAARAGLHGGFAFPVILGQDVLGVMEFFAREPRKAEPSVLTLMAAAGSQIGQFIDRRRALQRVTESEALSSAMVSAALDGVISIDADGRILEFNPSAAATFGIPRHEALGRELAALIVPERLRERHRQALRRCVATGEAHILGKRLEMPAIRADGTEFPVELAITRVDLGDHPIFTAHVRDITERRRMEEERIDLLAREHNARVQAERASHSKDEFLAIVSHELRTPLTAILGWASMLQGRRFDHDRIPQIYDSIFRNAQAQAQIVNDLLDVSRIVTGQLRLEFQPVDVSEVARLSLDTVRPTAMAKNVALQSDIVAGGCLVLADPARLQQIIWNLLSNAAKFTDAGGVISLAVQASNASVTIEVTDTGMGIRAELLPHVFQRFWQADSTTTRTHGGLGLGLALVRHLVELHGGEVHAASAGEGHGSTFTVTLPACIDPAASAGVVAPAADTEAAPDTLQALTVLIVDDDAGTRELFAAVLGAHGARVLCAASAADALSLYEGERPDLLLLDIGMPGENGFMLLQRIRRHEAARSLPPTPALAVTAYAGAIARKEVLDAGFVAHVPKPVLPRDLVTAVHQAMPRQS